MLWAAGGMSKITFSLCLQRTGQGRELQAETAAGKFQVRLGKSFLARRSTRHQMPWEEAASPSHVQDWVGQPSSRCASGQAPMGGRSLPVLLVWDPPLPHSCYGAFQRLREEQDEGGSPQASAPASSKLHSKMGIQQLEAMPGSPLFTAKVRKTLLC